MINDIKSSKSLRCFLAAFAFVALACAACQGKTRRTPADTLVIVSDSVTRDIDPRFSISNHDVKLSRLVAPGLTTPDTPDLLPKMLLAESITEVAPLQWRVRLRAGLRFSDGSDVTGEDVVYSYMSVLDPKTESLFRKGFAERFVKVVAVDELSADFFLVKPVATLFSDLDFGIISKSATEAAGGSYRDGRVIGAGPYRVKSFTPEHIVLEINEHYGSSPKPKMPRVEVKTVRDGNARNLMLVGGSADLCQNGVRVDLVDVIESRERVKIQTGPSAILTYLMMHNEDPILSDIRVRRAIAMAIDRPRIVEAKYGGRAILATGLLPTFHWAYNPKVTRYDFDRKAAMALLDEAGYPDPDGPGGKPRLTLSFKTSASQFRLAVARVIASQLGEIGIEINVHSFEFGTFFADIKAGNYQLGSMQTSAISEPDFYYTYFNSARIPNSEDPHLHNRWRYRNKRVDELTVLGRTTMGRAERKKIYGEVQRILADEVPIIPLWHEDNVAVMNVSVQGYEVVTTARMPRVDMVSKE